MDRWNFKKKYLLLFIIYIMLDKFSFLFIVFVTHFMFSIFGYVKKLFH